MIPAKWIFLTLMLSTLSFTSIAAHAADSKSLSEYTEELLKKRKKLEQGVETSDLKSATSSRSAG